MTLKELERRLSALEEAVQRLQAERSQGADLRRSDWRGALAEFADDPHLLSIFADAMKLREKERQQVRKKQPKKRRPQS